MIKKFTSLGLMSGTSGDGVDASIIQSDGNTEYKVIKDKYFQYDKEIQQNIHILKEKIHNIGHLKKFDKELSNLGVSSYGVSMTILEEVFLKVENDDNEKDAKSINYVV